MICGVTSSIPRAHCCDVVGKIISPHNSLIYKVYGEKNGLSKRADDHPDKERDITIVQDSWGRVLVVVLTYRGEKTIQIISARGAAAKGRREYAGGLRQKEPLEDILRRVVRENWSAQHPMRR
jgi:uncharacterized DUF497 family protein